MKINKYNLAKSWKIIKDVLNKREKSQLNNKFVINKNIVTDPEVIANSFNSFFVNIGSNLANKIPKIKKNSNDYIFNENPNSMFVFSTYPSEIKAIITNLKDSSPEYDGISTKILNRP